MGLGEAVARVWERLAGVEAAREAEAGRKTSGVPGGLGYGGSGWMPGAGLLPFRSAGAVNALPKPTPANLRRMAEIPAARRAINCIKDRIASMDWRIEVSPGAGAEGAEDRAARLVRLTTALRAPNETDSFRTLIEPVIEDILVGGFGSVEVEPGNSGKADVPVRLWSVDGATIQVNPTWEGDPEVPRYAQVSTLGGGREATALLDRELMYLKLNSRTHSLFGLGKMEVAFESINSFLASHRYAGRLASNSTVQYALWLKDRTPEQHERLTRWWQEDVEGSGTGAGAEHGGAAAGDQAGRRNGCGAADAVAAVFADDDCQCVRSAGDAAGRDPGCEPDDGAGDGRRGVPKRGDSSGKADRRSHYAGRDFEGAGMERSAVCVERAGQPR